MVSNKHTGKSLSVKPGKLSPAKVYNYIKLIEVDGYPRIRAYAEAIDPLIYELTPTQACDRLDYLKENYKGFNDIRESVLSEQQDWSLKRSAAAQNKAMDLLVNLLNKANEIATDPDADAKDLNVAVSTLKSVMPAFSAMAGKQNIETDTTDRKTRASKFIN